VLGDLEQQNAQQNVTKLAQQVRFVNGQNNGTHTQSFNAFIGNFGFQTLSSDITTPSNYGSKTGSHSFSGYNQGGYNAAKLNMSMPELYGGAGSYRNPAAGNSTAPNIRSAMFTLPILRVSQVEVNTDANERNVPYVARFNNFGNLALDTDRNASNGYLFNRASRCRRPTGCPRSRPPRPTTRCSPAATSPPPSPHYRMRGADSYVLFEPGVDRLHAGEQAARREGRLDRVAHQTPSSPPAITSSCSGRIPITGTTATKRTSTPS
jgi:hypothetical protein